MRRLLKAYFTVLGRNKRVLVLVAGLQIVSCLILTVLTAFFITVATVNIGSAKAGYYEGIAMADVKQRVAAVMQSAEVADICCYTENNYDFRYGEAVSASGTVYDFTDENAGDIIIMPKALVGEFEVGDEVEIGGKTFTVAAFGLYGRAQVPFFSAPDAALTNSIEINPANGTAASKALFASMQTEFADASYLNIPPVRNTFTMIAEMPLHRGRFPNGQPIILDLLLDLSHRLENGLMTFARRQKLKAFFGGKFHVDTHAVCQITDLLYDFRGGSRYGFCMDIAPEVVLVPQEKKGPVHQFHGIGRVFHNSGT